MQKWLIILIMWHQEQKNQTPCLGETVIQFTIRWNLGKTPQQIVEHVHYANY